LNLPLLLASYLHCIGCDPEDGGTIFTETPVNVYCNTTHHIAEDSALLSVLLSSSYPKNLRFENELANRIFVIIL
jgi:hypothetical protein